MSDRPFCPHCGYNLKADKEVKRGAWSITPEEVRFHGIKTALAPSECNLLHTLAVSYPRSVRLSVVANRYSESGSTESLKVRISRMRKKLGEHCPIETVHGLGYRWCDPSE